MVSALTADMMTAWSVMARDDADLGITRQTLEEIQAGKYFFLAAFTMLLYDHLLTLSDEVETVWKRKKTYILYLFLTVRYYALITLIVVSYGFFSTTITREQCSRWMLFLPLGITMPLTLLPGILMAIRVYALWDRNKTILYVLCACLLAQAGEGLWQYTVPGASPAPLPLDNYQFHFCIYLPPKRIGRASTTFIFMELAFDSVIFLLTLVRTIYTYLRHRGTSHIRGGSLGLFEHLIRDGAFYFGIIFSVNLTWILMILYAPTNLRAIASIPSACVTTIMICRITLSLRTAAYGSDQNGVRTARLNLAGARLPRPRRGDPALFAESIEIGVHVETQLDGSAEPSDSPKRALPFENGNGYEQPWTPARVSPPVEEVVSPTIVPSPASSLMPRFHKEDDIEEGRRSSVSGWELEDMAWRRREPGKGHYAWRG